MPAFPKITLRSALLLTLITASMALSGCIWPGPHYRRGGRPVYVTPSHRGSYDHDRRPSYKPNHHRWQDDSRYRPRG